MRVEELRLRIPEWLPEFSGTYVIKVEMPDRKVWAGYQRVVLDEDVEDVAKTGDRIGWVGYNSNLNVCERRFAQTKEFMHMFDEIGARVVGDESHMHLMREIDLHPPQPSESYKAENLAQWKAVLILAPNEVRNECVKRIKDGQFSIDDVAMYLRVPQVIVSSILSDSCVHARRLFVGQ